MTYFFNEHADFILFFNGLSFVVLSAVCFILWKNRDRNLPWEWLGIFGIMRGLLRWLELYALTFGDSRYLEILRIFLSIISFLFLVEFGRAGISGIRHGIGRWAHIPLLVPVVAAGLEGLGAIEAVTRYSLGFTGGLLTAYALYLLAKERVSYGRRWLIAGSIFAGTYAVAAGLVVPPAPFFPASLVNNETFHRFFGLPIQLLRGLAALAFCLSIWEYSLSYIRTRTDIYRHSLESYSFWPSFVLVVILAAGWLLAWFMGQDVRERETREALSYLTALSNHIESELNDVEHSAAERASLPAMRRALASGAAAEIGKAEAILGKCRHGKNPDVYYCDLLDSQGRLVTSCDKGKPEMHTAHVFMAYFREALSGKHGRFFYTSGNPDNEGYYVGEPVKGAGGRTLGVLVVKKDLSSIKSSIRSHPNCLLLDSEGNVLISDLPGTSIKFASPAGWSDGSSRPERISVDAVNGAFVTLKGGHYLATARKLGSRGWTVLVLNPAEHIMAGRFIGIFITLAFCVFSVVFFSMLFLARESSARISESELELRRHRDSLEETVKARTSELTAVNRRLQESNSRLETLIQAVPDMVFLRDIKGKYLMVNKTLADFFGAGSEKFIGKTNDELMPPELSEMCRKSDEAALRSSEPVTADEQAVRRDGEHRQLEVIKAPVRDNEGNIAGLIGVARDITERKHMEDLLEQAVIRATEERNKLEELNIELERYRKRLEDLVRERTARLIETNEALLAEIAEHERTGETLRESEAKYKRLSNEFHTLLDAIPDSLMLLSPEMKILWANTGSARFLGVKVSELTGQYCHKLWRNSLFPCDNCPARKCFGAGEMAYSQNTAPGSRVWDVRAFPMKDDSGSTINVIVLSSDVTEKITLQQEAVRAGQLATLGELAAGVAHEVNNPINGIINYAQILIDRAKKKGEDDDIAGMILKEGERVARITGGLLSFARDRREKKKAVAVVSALSDSLSLTIAQLRKDGIRVDVNVPQNLPEILANAGQLQQVFLNIVSNARYALNKKYSGAHPDKILDILGEKITAGDRTYVKVTFYDKGVGIPSGIRDKILNPFFSTKPAGEGTGLGLSISHGIIKDHDGRLVIESAEGIYTRVDIELPVISREPGIRRTPS